MITECRPTIKLVDIGARDDSIISANNVSNYSNAALLTKENSLHDHMTFEWNYSLLDGSLQCYENDISEIPYPLVSAEISDEDCNRGKDVELDISFSYNHSVAGLTMEFLGSLAWPRSIVCEWYNSDETLISEAVFRPDSKMFVGEHKVENFRRIKIYFNGSVVPYRRAKLINLYYGLTLNFDSSNVTAGTLLEEVDPISSKLSINKADITLFDAEKEFNALNPGGKYSLLQTGQEFIITEKIDDSYLDLGTFYLEKWSSDSETEIKFKLIDALGVLDKTKFIEGEIYRNATAEYVISKIMKSAGWEKYEIDDNLRNITVSGYIPICSHREALQQVVFAIRAVADCSRSNKIKIYRQNPVADLKIKKDRIFMSGSSVEVKEYVSAIEITTHKYVLSSEVKEAFDGILPKGETTVTFSSPFSNLKTSSGTIIESGINYAVIKTNEESECTITGNAFIDNQSTYINQAKELEAGEMENVLTIKNATLVDKASVYLLSEHLFDYYKLRKTAEERFISNGERTGYWVNLQSQYDMYVSGCIEAQEIDLTGGFISKAQVTGYATAEINLIFAGEELYTGEEIGVL